MAEVNHPAEQPLIDPAVLEDLYWRVGSKDRMTEHSIAAVVQSLVEFGVSPADIRYHLKNEADMLNKKLTEPRNI